MSILPKPTFEIPLIETDRKFSKLWNDVLNLNNCLFPEIKEQLGELTTNEEKLVQVLQFANIEDYILEVKVTNPPKDRKQIARAFIAKQIYNLLTTRELIDRLKCDRVLRNLCGWRYPKDIPHESKFSRVFAMLSQSKAASLAHENFVDKYLSNELFLYNSSDSTAVDVREKTTKKKKEEKPKQKKKRGRPKKGEAREKKLSILEQQQEMKSVEEMLGLISTDTDTGIKKDSKGNNYKWIGGKLHLCVVDGDIPITAIYSSASVHDSSVALPLIAQTTKRVNYLYDLMDAGYDARIIKEYSKKLEHKPVIDINPKNSKELKEQIKIQEEEKEKFKNINLRLSTDDKHYKHRSSVERVNSYLKDSYGCKEIYYKGATKVSSVLSFATLALCIVQSLKLIS